MLLGHLCGDYLFQNAWMAYNKGKKELIGWAAAILHSVTYTLTVCIVMLNFDYRWIILVFLSHVFIDHYSTATWFLKKIKGLEKPTRYDANTTYSTLYWINYVVVDNTMHIILMIASYTFLYS